MRALDNFLYLGLTAAMALFVVGCPPLPTPSLVTDATAVTVAENGTNQVQVKLSSQPSSDLTVVAAWQSGDADIAVQAGASLTFTPYNWSAYQPVLVSALDDGDSTNGTAIIRCAASGLTGVDVTVTEQDDDSVLTPKALVGWIKDTEGQAIANATVRAGTQVASTDVVGLYRIEDVEQAEALLVSVEVPGHTANSRAIDTASVQLPTANFVLKERVVPQRLNIDTGGTVQDGAGNSLTLAAKSLVSKDGKVVTGSVDVSITALDVVVDSDLSAFPGAFSGVTLGRKTSETVQLETFALAEYVVSQEGEELQLNTPGTIRLQLNHNRLVVDDVVPSWYFNEATGFWEETGIGTVRSDGVGGLYWESTVPHLSWWNSDRPITEKQCVTGRVLDQFGNPVPGAQVYSQGVDHEGNNYTTTDAYGQYCMDVKCNSTVRVSVLLPGADTAVDNEDVVLPPICGVVCEGGDCTVVRDLAGYFPSCIEGYVRSFGIGVSGVSVYSSWGVTGVTDADGYYKMNVPENVPIAVYVVGAPATVLTSPAGGAACAQVDFSPGDSGEHETQTVILPGDVPLELVWVPAGTFIMGGRPDEQDSYGFDAPQHQVTLSHGFWMGKYEVTQGQWMAVMNSSTSYFQGEIVGNVNTDSRPADTVSWDDAQSFVARLNTHIADTNQGPASMRLPTEAEWEYACRAGSTTRFYWGDDPEYTLIGAYAWYGVNSGGQTHDAGGMLANAFGLFDMSGNVMEWVQDVFTIYTSDAVIDPVGPENSIGRSRAIRGGSWGNNENVLGQGCRSARHGGASPELANFYYGFRIAR